MSCLGNGRSNRSISSYARTLRVWFLPFEQIRCVLPDMLGRPPIVPWALDHLSERAFYTHSDSVLFTESPDDPPMDPFRIILLLFTLRRGKGPRLHHGILCRIPKNYGYKTAKGNTMCKIRDFSLDVEGATQLNNKVLKDHTLDESKTPNQIRTSLLSSSRIPFTATPNDISALDANNLQEISSRVQEAGVGAGYFRDLPVLIY